MWWTRSADSLRKRRRSRRYNIFGLMRVWRLLPGDVTNAFEESLTWFFGREGSRFGETGAETARDWLTDSRRRGGH